ncbi:tyrosine-type recombinase/integrase [Pseudarthrobacter sp. LMD1-1-1.1]|uniref:tyrosine-type recombinase/integrase n=1 Tax=Pseudarthrobacter sp. LMD1-1-1.1 TaxID=3135242 RepID=UPI003417B221
MSKRANGEGSIYKRESDGRYVGALTYPHPETGKSCRKVFYGKTRADVRTKMREASDRLEEGQPVADSKATVAQWLTHWTATTLAASHRKESTRSLYRTLATKHVMPEPFGALKLDRLKPSDVEALVLNLRSRTKQVPADGGGLEEVRALSDSTIRTTYTVLRSALDGAVRDGLLARNPAAMIRRPGVKRTEAKHLSPTEVRSLLRAAQSSRYHSALLLIAATGIRRGECLALRWADIDHDAGVLRIRGTLSRSGGRLVVTEPKSERSRRLLPLTPVTAALLTAHRKAQVTERLHAGSEWTDTGFVFTTETGQPVDPRNLYRVAQSAAKRTGLDGIGIHSLRHSAATAMLEAGVNIKAVSDLLGHSSVSITGDIYGHTSDESARAAVTRLSDVMGF